ncbi:lipase maturation factor 2-like [Chelonus insularis]|uniref:lipase maturation factor 2-like n=1 Tax=Chelonus insularis TaxID=460826 RepID=UPI00158E0E95|nr:lipase maturation factor 2-like [Chelonus insularis]
MITVRYTRNLFLRGMCIIYLFAFLSFYLQIPGLYGNNGLLPVRTQLEFKGNSNLWQKLYRKPTLLWFAPHIGLNYEYMLDIIALCGIVISFLGFISQQFCNSLVFVILWSLYYSLHQIGQVFVLYQWDTFLLESGFLCVLIAPLITSTEKTNHPSDTITFWTLRWLLFRFMFSNGSVKLISWCPIWWNLNALSHHFETQCLPGSLAWYAHHLPTWYLRLNTALSIVFELIVPFLYFFPNKKVRIITFYLQMYIQIHIIATGNWGFRDFLIICLSLGLLDDQFFYKKKSKNENSVFYNFLSILICICVYSGIIYGIIIFYKIRLLKNWTIHTEIGFTQKDFDHFLPNAVIISFLIGLISLGFTVADAITHSILSTKFTIKKIITFISTLFSTFAVCFIFVMSLVPFSTLHPSLNSTIPAQIKQTYSKIDHLHVINGYGLFQRMTGVNGRPEIIIEGSNSIDGPWKEYEFIYKPGNVNNSLPFVAPHSPRLDWQMWFAALETYHKNPWIMSLAYRLLTGQKEVLALLNDIEKPFSNNPPKYIRGSLYHYHFAPWTKTSNDQSWWRREKVGEYFPIFSCDHPPLLEYLKKLNIFQDEESIELTNQSLKNILDSIRLITRKIEPSLVLWSMFTAGCAIIITRSNIHSRSR